MFLHLFNLIIAKTIHEVRFILIGDAHVNCLVEIYKHIPFIAPFRYCMQSMVKNVLVSGRHYVAKYDAIVCKQLKA